MTDIAPITPTTPLRDLVAQQSLADPDANELDKDAFLQLLVAQLRYQDPLNPNDPAEFMATTAQFTVVEKLDELTQQGENTAIISGLSMASSLVGRTVTFVGGDDAITSGLVSSAQVANGEVTLVTDNGVVDLSTVIGIGAAVGVDTSNVDQTDPVPAPTVGGSTSTGAGPAPTTNPVPDADPASTAASGSPSDPSPAIPTVDGLAGAPVAIPTSLYSDRPSEPTTPEVSTP